MQPCYISKRNGYHLTSAWVEHSPDLVGTGWTKAEADCPCGIRERHRHCTDCGAVATIGDWDKPGKPLPTIYL